MMEKFLENARDGEHKIETLIFLYYLTNLHMAEIHILWVKKEIGKKKGYLNQKKEKKHWLLINEYLSFSGSIEVYFQ